MLEIESTQLLLDYAMRLKWLVNEGVIQEGGELLDFMEFTDPPRFAAGIDADGTDEKPRLWVRLQNKRVGEFWFAEGDQFSVQASERLHE